jgi:hypothetical protein
MSDEPKDFIDHMIEESVLRYGRKISAREAGEAFLHHGLDARINHLKNIRKDETLSINKAAERLTYERAIRDAHTAARRAGR